MLENVWRALRRPASAAEARADASRKFRRPTTGCADYRRAPGWATSWSIARMPAAQRRDRPDRPGSRAGRAIRAQRRRRRRRCRLQPRPVPVAPDVAWRGRVVDALGAADRRGRRVCRAAPTWPAARLPRFPAARRHGAEDRRARHRHLHAALLRPAPRHLRRLRRRQVDAARHAGRAPTPSTRWSWRWSANAAARCANSSKTRSATRTWPRPSPSCRPATRAP